MSCYNLSWFRRLLTGFSRPEHPLGDFKEAQVLLAETALKDPRVAFGELTDWLRTFGPEDGFTPGRRARIVLLIEDFAGSHWRSLAHEYLAPDDQPSEHRDGDPGLLQAMMALSDAQDAAFAASFADGVPASKWLAANAALVLSRWTRALVRRATLRRMLRLPTDKAIWPVLHGVYRRALRTKTEGTPVPTRTGGNRRTSVRQEYLRAVMVDLASPDSLKARDMELVYRIAGRFAASVQIVGSDQAGVVYGIDTEGVAGPIPLARLYPRGPSVIFFDCRNCVAQMLAFSEARRGAHARAPDSAFGPQFTGRELSAILKHSLACWGLSPPQRKSGRVPLAGQARVASGYEGVLALCAPLEQGGWSRRGENDSDLRIVLTNTEGAQELTSSRARHEAAGKLHDASASGIGLSLPRLEAAWARVGVLVCIYVEPGPDWAIGTIRRARANESELDVGVEVLCHRPYAAWVRPVRVERENVWAEAMVQERHVDIHFVHAILLTDPPAQAQASGEMVMPVGCVEPGMALDLPLPDGVQRLRVREVRESTGDFMRVRVEWLESLDSPAASRAQRTAFALRALFVFSAIHLSIKVHSVLLTLRLRCSNDAGTPPVRC